MSISANYPTIRPSLLLDFANTRLLDPRITFTRASTGTFYDQTSSALAEQNLLLQSQTFGTSPWAVQAGSTVTVNTVAAPDGTTTGTTFNEGTGTAYHDASQSVTLPVGAFTFSTYIKYDTQQYAIIAISSTGVAYFAGSFDLVGGTVSSSANAGSVTTLTGATITSVGSGWYRCTISGTVVTAGSFQMRIATSPTGTIGAFGVGTYTGTSQTIYIWGAQLEQRSTVTAYTPTTTAAITNYIPVLQTAASGVARFDCNPVTRESLGLLIEEARTNISTYSSDFTFWSATAVTISSAANIAPDGTQTAQKLVETTTTNFHAVNRGGTAGAFTFSFHVKAAGRNYAGFAGGVSANDYVLFDLVTGTITLNGSGVTNARITSVGNSWYRCSGTCTFSVAGPYIYASNSAVTTYLPSYAGDGYSGIFIWGAQLEAGAFPTSYIPTVASQVTRAADAASITGTNFSSWYSADQGTFYGEASSLGGSAFRSLLRAVDNSTANNFFEIGLVTGTNNGVGRFQVTSGGSSQWDTGNLSSPAFTANTFYKVIAGSKVNDFAGSRDAGTVATDTLGTVAANLAAFEIGGRHLSSANLLNGTIKKIAYYPIRATNAQLQALTS